MNHPHYEDAGLRCLGSVVGGCCWRVLLVGVVGGCCWRVLLLGVVSNLT